MPQPLFGPSASPPDVTFNTGRLSLPRDRLSLSRAADQQSAPCGRRAYALGGYVMRDGNIDTIKSVENVEI
jgi:hypothetical protein